MHSYNNKETTGFFSNKKVGGSFFQPKLSMSDQVVQRSSEDSGVLAEQDCAGWESDPQSFCIRVGKFFMQAEFGSSAQVLTVDVAEDGGCSVKFEDGVVLTVQKMGNQKVFVQVSPFSTKKISGRVRCYSYVCSTSGRIDFVIVPCSS
jgi:hypothetical protein